MTARIWPGALCVVAAPGAINDGRVVVADEFASDKVHAPSGLSGCWWVSANHVLVTQNGPRLQCWFPARWLRPILPPPGTESTEDRAPVELTAG